MSSNLDNRSAYKQLDQQNVFDHLIDAPEQLLAGWAAGSSAVVPASYAQAKHIVILAGGEDRPLAEAARLMAQVTSRVPVTVISTYQVPAWVGSDTVVIAYDYSGNSEQVVAAFEAAVAARARAVSITIGGAMAAVGRRYKVPHLALEYGAPARYAGYYSFPYLLAVLAKLGAVEVRDDDVREASVLMHALFNNFKPDVSEFQNGTKQLANKIMNRPTIIIGSGLLVPIAYRWQLQLSMAAKALVNAAALPEFGQTLINGLVAPEGRGAPARLGIILQSKYDHARNKLQQTLSYQVFQARRMMFEPIFMHPSGSPLGEVMLASLYGDLVAYYLAIASGRDPSVTEASTYIAQHLQMSPNE